MFLVLLISVAHAASCCNQLEYDKVYSDIIRRALNSKLTQKDLDQRNRAIETLRSLCQGQISTWERGKR